MPASGFRPLIGARWTSGAELLARSWRPRATRSGSTPSVPSATRSTAAGCESLRRCGWAQAAATTRSPRETANWCPDSHPGPSSVTSVSNNLRGRTPAWPTEISRTELPTIRRNRTSTRPSSWRTQRHLAQLRVPIRRRLPLRMQRRQPCLAINLRCHRLRFLRLRALTSAPSHLHTLRRLHRSPPTPPPAQGRRPPATTGHPLRHPSSSPRRPVSIAAPPLRSRHTASRRQA